MADNPRQARHLSDLQVTPPSGKETPSMANMSYCRFNNTLQDLQDCYEHMDDDDLSEAEQEARTRLIRLCAEMADNYEDEGESDA